MSASGVNSRAPEAGYLAVGVGTPGICLLGPLPAAPAKWKTERSTLALVLKVLPPDGWDYWAASLRPETAGRALASTPSWLELVPAGQPSVPLVSVSGVREQAALLWSHPPSFSSPGSVQQEVWRPRGGNLSQTISVAPL